MARLNMLSPWMTYYHEMVAFFKKDDEVNVVWDDSGDVDTIKLYVKEESKAEALMELLPTTKEFGVVTVNIEIIPANDKKSFFITRMNHTNPALFSMALRDNNAVSFIKTVEGIFSNPITYIVFNKEVVQYFNDSLGDYFGQCSTLYQELAKDIFGTHEGVFYCTNKADGCSTLTITTSASNYSNF